jgi:2-polyprenyl-3-methyl-5-hydroxy-6-metoxy-1,4-benzoquinol methylase
MNQESKSLHCKICQEEKNFESVVTISNPRKEFETKEFIYYQCTTCNFWMLLPQIDKSQLQKIYAQEEYYEELSQEIKNPILKVLFNLKIYPGYDDFVNKYATGKKTILDIGCGNGDFVQKIREKGFETYGIDPYPVAVKQTQKKIGVENVYQGYTSEIQKINKQFDCITMWHVLEHVDNPIDDLQTINSQLNSNGLYIFEVPNANSFSFTLFKDYYCWNMVPEHINYFTKKSLNKALQKTGFNVVHMDTPPRALLNFALSIKKYAVSQKVPSLMVPIITLLFAPISIIIGIFTAYLQKGEVIRVVALKK